MFIGLGSTGGKIVSRIKRQLDPTVDDLTRQFYRYARIQSETVCEPGVDENIPGFVFANDYLDCETTVKVFQGNQDKEIVDDFNKWWPRKNPDDNRPWVPGLGNLYLGSGGVRPIGRLLLHYACMDQRVSLLSFMTGIRQSIQNAYVELKPERRQRVAFGGESFIECYLFGLLAGGTCSGSLIDVAYLIKEGLKPARLHGVMLLGDICYYNKPAPSRDALRVTIQRKNTVSALAEMSLIQCATGRDIVQRNWIRKVGGEALEDECFADDPFIRMVFVGAENDAGCGLGSFDAYQEFVANYYSRLHTSLATAEQAGKVVDDLAATLTELDTQYPTRFNNSSRIGMLSLSVPAAKIMAAAKSKVAIRLAADHFKNAAESRWQQAQNDFLVQVRWPETNTLLEPAPEDLSPEQFRPLPENRDEFRGLYEQRLQDIKGRYEQWKRLRDPEAQAKHAEFVQMWRSAIEVLINDFLGRNRGTEVSLGGLKAVLKSLLDHVKKRTDELNNRALEIQTKLQRAGEASPESVLRRESDAVAADFPESSLVNPVAIWRRRNWTGDQNLLGLLTSYRDAVRADAVATVTAAALKQVRAELESIELARALIARLTGNEVLAALQCAADDEFDTSRAQGRTPHEEVLNQRVDVVTYFVDPLLEQPDPSVESNGEGVRPTRLDATCADVMTSWRSADGQPLYAAFANLVELLLEQGALNEDEALRFERVRTSVGSLKREFERQVAAAVNKHLSGPIDAISIWHALAKYARKRGGDVEQTLLDYFAGLKANVGLFARLSRDAKHDKGHKGSHYYYICDSAEAKEAFISLEIKDPELFLEKLLTNALGHKPEAMAGARPKCSEVLVLMDNIGDTPLYFAEFDRDVRRMLNPEGAAERTYDKYWMDRRFPDWIAEWQKSQPPRFMPD
jgi:hypothetical protein